MIITLSIKRVISTPGEGVTVTLAKGVILSLLYIMQAMHQYWLMHALVSELYTTEINVIIIKIKINIIIYKVY